MDAEEFFAKRDRLAEAFGMKPHEVPAEAVWFVSETPGTLTLDQVAKSFEIAKGTDSWENEGGR